MSGGDEVGDLLEFGCVGARSGPAQRCVCLGVRRRGHRACPVEPIAAHIGQLSMPLIRALRLPQCGFCPGHVEDVVDDLEQHAQFSSESTESGECRRWIAFAGQEQDALHRCADQPAGLELVQAAQRPTSLAANVDVLPADHAVDAGRVGELGDRREHRGGLAALLAQDEPESLGVEPVAGQDRDVLAEADVARRAPAAQVVVVHRREVVVDQRVRVDQLERGGERQHVGRLAAQRARRRERQHRPDALAAGQQRIAHRLLEARGGRTRARTAARRGSPRPACAGARGTRR